MHESYATPTLAQAYFYMSYMWMVGAYRRENKKLDCFVQRTMSDDAYPYAPEMLNRQNNQLKMTFIY